MYVRCSKHYQMLFHLPCASKLSCYQNIAHSFDFTQFTSTLLCSQHQFTSHLHTFESCVSVEHRSISVTKSIQHRCGGSVVMTPSTNVVTSYWSLRIERQRERIPHPKRVSRIPTIVCVCRERRTQQTLRLQGNQHQFTFIFYALIPHCDLSVFNNKIQSSESERIEVKLLPFTLRANIHVQKYRKRTLT